MGKDLAIKIISLLSLLLGVVVIGSVIYHLNLQQEALVHSSQTNDLNTTSTIVATEVTPVATSTTLIFGGDVMLSRVVDEQMEKYQDFTWPFQALGSVLKSADLAIINLESPFTYNGKHDVTTGSFSFDADPRGIAGLQLAGIDVAGLANNHFGNQGQQGMFDTFNILKNAGITHAGAGVDREHAHEPQILERNGIRFGFLAYGYPEDLYVATDKLAGIASMNTENAQADIRKLRDHVDVLVVLMHAGTEYEAKSNWQQEEFAHAVIDAGADVVVGHHPHWVQQTEIYRGKPILYSLGNLVFDQMWSEETQQGVLAQLSFKDTMLQNIEIIPIHIYNYGQPEIVTDEKERQQILNRMGLTSSTIAIKN